MANNNQPDRSGERVDAKSVSRLPAANRIDRWLLSFVVLHPLRILVFFMIVFVQAALIVAGQETPRRIRTCRF